MAEPFKNLFHRGGVARLADHLAVAHPALERARFLQLATEGLEALELKDRTRQIQAALGTCLPADPGEACVVVHRLLDQLEAAAGGEPLESWTLWPVSDWIGVIGVGDIQAALAVMRRLTVHFTCEFGIRSLLLADFGTCRTTLESWLDDPREAVRRLISEGTRPRLPWGAQLRALVADPRPMLPLLAALRDDPSESVRRSVANHLNDISKDHPELFLEVAEDWMRGAPAQRQRLVRHACRTLFKAGHPRALVLHGWGVPRLEGLRFELTEPRVAVGGGLAFRLAFRSASLEPQSLRLDYAVHYRKANGSLRPKVFSWKKIEVAPGERVEALRRVGFRPVTTRRLYPGAHRLDLRINGQVLATADFELVAD